MMCVALRKESVDRNGEDIDNCPKNMKSLSARRAWIEIACRPETRQKARWSLSARRAWIEIKTLRRGMG